MLCFYSSVERDYEALGFMVVVVLIFLDGLDGLINDTVASLSSCRPYKRIIVLLNGLIMVSQSERIVDWEVWLLDSHLYEYF